MLTWERFCRVSLVGAAVIGLSGAGCDEWLPEDEPPEVPPGIEQPPSDSALGDPTIMINRAISPLFMQAEFENGVVAGYFCERDEDDLPSALSAIAVADPVYGKSYLRGKVRSGLRRPSI